MAETEVAPRKREGRPHIVPPAPGWRMDGRDRAEGWPVLEDVDGALGLSLSRVRCSGPWSANRPRRRRTIPSPPANGTRRALREWLR